LREAGFAVFDACAQRRVEDDGGFIHPGRVARLVEKLARAVAIAGVPVRGDEHAERRLVGLDAAFAHLASERLHVAESSLATEGGEHGVVRRDVASNPLGRHAVEHSRRLAVLRRAHSRAEKRVVHARVHPRARLSQRVEGALRLLPLPALPVRRDERRVHEHGRIVVGKRTLHLRERSLREAPLVRAGERGDHLVVRPRVRRRAAVAHLQKKSTRLHVRGRAAALTRAQRRVIKRQRNRPARARLGSLRRRLTETTKRRQRALRVPAVRRAFQLTRRGAELRLIAPVARAREGVVSGRHGVRGDADATARERLGTVPPLVETVVRDGARAAGALRGGGGFVCVSALLLARGASGSVPSASRLRAHGAGPGVQGVVDGVVTRREHLAAGALDEFMLRPAGRAGVPAVAGRGDASRVGRRTRPRARRDAETDAAAAQRGHLAGLARDGRPRARGDDAGRSRTRARGVCARGGHRASRQPRDGRHLRLSPPDRFSASDPSGARHTFRALRLATRSPIGSLD